MYTCRKRRQYACQDISTLVSKAGVETTQLLGLSGRWSELEVFDDTTYKSRTAEQWVPAIPGNGKQQCSGLHTQRAEHHCACMWLWASGNSSD